MTEIRIIPTYQFDSEYGPARQGRDALEVGNPVILYKSGRRFVEPKFVDTIVTRATLTQITTAEGTRHYRHHGKEVGKATRYDGSSYILVAADEQMVASVKEAKEKAAISQANALAEREAKRMRREIREHSFLTYADGDDVRMVLSIMNRWKAASDEKSAREHAKWEAEQAELNARWNR